MGGILHFCATIYGDLGEPISLLRKERDHTNGRALHDNTWTAIRRDRPWVVSSKHTFLRKQVREAGRKSGAHGRFNSDLSGTKEKLTFVTSACIPPLYRAIYING